MHLTILLVFIFSLPDPALAKDKPGIISAKVYQSLQKSEKFIQNKTYQNAITLLKETLATREKNSYERAVLLRSLSSIYALNENYQQAARYLAQAVNSNQLQDQEQKNSILNLGQLYMALENFQAAIKTLEPWLKKNNSQDPELYVLMANAHAQLKQYKTALPYIKKAILLSNTPQQSWYQLNLALLLELKRYQSAANLLKTLIERYPESENYWNQLFSVYQQLKQYKNAVAIQLLSYKKGFEKSEKQIMDMANLLLYIESPYEAAELIASAMQKKQVRPSTDTWEILAQAWNMAREADKAIDALENASKSSDKGQLYLQLAQIYMEKEDWQSAIKAARLALKKGGIKKPGRAYLIIGMGYYEMKQMQQAKKYFSKAQPYNRKIAKQWLDYINQS